MKAADARERTTEDLENLEKELTRDLFKARIQNHTNQLQSNAQIGHLRRDIARVKTILRQRELQSKDGEQ